MFMQRTLVQLERNVKTIKPIYILKNDINISQGSVAARVRCGKIFNNHLIANLLLYHYQTVSVTVRLSVKKIKIGQLTKI